MYSRNIADQVYTFEASGGLLNASLVMQDRETDSYWSIITDEALHGQAKGQKLRQLAGSTKITWGQWRDLHPNTQVLSVDGKEHDPRSPYDKYFASEEGFRKLQATDDRLADKAHIFAFHWQGKPQAVPHSLFAQGGAVVTVGHRQLFLYRQPGDSTYRSTIALLLQQDQRLSHDAEGWKLHTANGRAIPWDAEQRSFGKATAMAKPMAGFDTFWYIWSLSNPDTEILTDVSLTAQSPK